jgi:hypothetical protein
MSSESRHSFNALNIGENPSFWMTDGDRIFFDFSLELKDAKVASARASNLAIPRVIGIGWS